MICVMRADDAAVVGRTSKRLSSPLMKAATCLGDECAADFDRHADDFSISGRESHANVHSKE